MLDLEGDCISVDWIQTFSNTYYSSTGRKPRSIPRLICSSTDAVVSGYPTLYSSPSWWEQCTGNSDAFTQTNALMMACYNSSPCTPQGDWPYWTFWQNADSNPYGGDSDQFSADYTQLQKYASG